MVGDCEPLVSIHGLRCRREDQAVDSVQASDNKDK